MRDVVLNGTQPIVPALAAAPTGVPVGYQYYDTVDEKVYLWDGSEWKGVGGTGGTSSSLWLAGSFLHSSYGAGPWALADYNVGANYPPWGVAADRVLREVRGTKPKTLRASGYSTSGTLDFTVRRARVSGDATWTTIAQLQITLPSSDYFSGVVNIDPETMADGDWIAINNNAALQALVVWRMDT